MTEQEQEIARLQLRIQEMGERMADLHTQIDDKVKRIENLKKMGKNLLQEWLNLADELACDDFIGLNVGLLQDQPEDFVCLD
jgi:hypothetical protein